jgi:hypothetical protein
LHELGLTVAHATLSCVQVHEVAFRVLLASSPPPSRSSSSVASSSWQVTAVSVLGYASPPRSSGLGEDQDHPEDEGRVDSFDDLIVPTQRSTLPIIRAALDGDNSDEDNSRGKKSDALSLSNSFPLWSGHNIFILEVTLKSPSMPPADSSGTAADGSSSMVSARNVSVNLVLTRLGSAVQPRLADEDDVLPEGPVHRSRRSFLSQCNGGHFKPNISVPPWRFPSHRTLPRQEGSPLMPPPGNPSSRWTLYSRKPPRVYHNAPLSPSWQHGEMISEIRQPMLAHYAEALAAGSPLVRHVLSQFPLHWDRRYVLTMINPQLLQVGELPQTGQHWHVDVPGLTPAALFDDFVPEQAHILLEAAQQISERQSATALLEPQAELMEQLDPTSSGMQTCALNFSAACVDQASATQCVSNDKSSSSCSCVASSCVSALRSSCAKTLSDPSLSGSVPASTRRPMRLYAMLIGVGSSRTEFVSEPLAAFLPPLSPVHDWGGYDIRLRRRVYQSHLMRLIQPRTMLIPMHVMVEFDGLHLHRSTHTAVDGWRLFIRAMETDE